MRTKKAVFLVIALALFVSSGLSAQGLASGQDAFIRLFKAGLEKDPRAASISGSYRAARASAKETEAKRLLDLNVSSSYAYTIPDKDVDEKPGIPDPKDSGASTSKASLSTLGPLGSSIGAGIDYKLSHDDKDRSGSIDADIDLSLPVLVNGKLFDPGISPAAKRLAVDSAIETASENERSERSAFVLSLMKLILDYARAQRNASLSEKAADISRRDLEIARVKYGNGAFSFKELRDAESAAESDNLAAISARASLKNQRRRLEASTGLPAAELESLSILCPRPPDAFSPGPAAESLAVVKAAHALEDARASRIVDGARSAPKLSFSGGYSWELEDTALKEGEKKSKGPLSLSAGLSLDLGFAAAARRKEAAEARVQAAAKGLEEAKSGAAAESGDAVSRAEAAKAQADYLAASVESAKARLSEMGARAKAGTVLILDLDRAALALEQAEAGLEDKAAEYLLALADIYRLSGRDGADLLSDMGVAAR